MFTTNPRVPARARAHHLFFAIAAAAVLVAGLALAPAVRAQTPATAASADSLPHFTVVSVRPSPPNEKFYPWQRDNGYWAGRRNPLIPVIDYAYEVNRQDIEGLPAWVRGTFYDFQATMPPDTTVAEFRLMMRSMLADRFQFKAHTEMRPENVTVLTTDGPPGPDLKPASPDCVPTPNHPKGAFGTVKSGPTLWILAGCAVSTAEIAHYFTVFLGYPVADHTGLKGLYDVNVKATPPPPLPNEPFASKWRAREIALKDAFQSQLGLNLDLSKTVKEPFPVLVVDHIAPLSAN